MPDFRLNDEQRQYQKLAREFAANEIAPRAAHCDESGEFPFDIYRQAWELGLLNVHIPGAHGGFGLSVLDGCLIAEELAWGCTGIAAAAGANSLAQAPLILLGNDDQKKEFLGPFSEDCLFAAACGLDEPRAAGTARRYDEEYVIEGEFPGVTNAGVASWFVVVAATDSGPCALVVPKDAGGIQIGDREYALGQRAADRRTVVFRETRIPARYLIGQAGDGLKVTEETLNRWLPTAAAAAAGLSRSCLDHALRYSQERVTFGQPIANHQAVGFMLADMAKDIEAARLLAWQAAWFVGHKQAEITGNRHAQASIAWTFAVDAAMRIATDAVQVFGGYGYTREYPVEKLMRDAKVMQLTSGTSQRQRVAIGKQLVG